MGDAIFGLVIILFWIAFIVVNIVAWCMIAKRLGYAPMAGFLMLIPVANLFVLFYWAFVESPNEMKIRRLELSTSRKLDKSTTGFLSDLERETGGFANFQSEFVDP